MVAVTFCFGKPKYNDPGNVEDWFGTPKSRPRVQVTPLWLGALTGSLEPRELLRG